MNRALLTIIAMALTMPCMAQSQKRLQEEAARKEAEKSPTAVTLSQRARSQYTAQTSVPEEVTWKRDIYRELDLTKEKNAALYYPEEPLGDRVNFFTLVFNLILDGRIKAYEYRLDGNERFLPDNLLDIESMLDRFYIDYTKDEKTGKYIVAQKDIPSSEIGKYYIKESNYLDQMSNYHTKVTAICPVMIDSDFGDEATKKPMFWLNYDEISPYLGQTPVMTSSFNNTSNMSLDDYFVLGCYDGEIYKTSNLRNQPLSDYCDTDSALKAERQNIEDQLIGFQKGLWNEKTVSSSKNAKDKPAEEASAETGARKTESDDKSGSKTREKKEKQPKPARTPKQASSGERISVHR
ncbi:MAG: gliding motility protein GldN [Bacteroidaceae bacterium]|nr:gliding motility protein GldN [Bacteroidaceae bacterium]